MATMNASIKRGSAELAVLAVLEHQPLHGYDLDICLFRVYENDKPVQVKHFLPIAQKAVNEGDLVFVSGHPGRKRRDRSAELVAPVLELETNQHAFQRPHQAQT